MSAFIEKLRLEDVAEQHRDALKPVAERINSTIDFLNEKFSRGIGSESLKQQVRTISFRTDESAVEDTDWPPVKLDVAPQGAWVIAFKNLSDPEALFYEVPGIQFIRQSDGKYGIRFISGLDVATEYELTIIIFGG